MILNSRIADPWLGVKAHVRSLNLAVRAADPEGLRRAQASEWRISFNANLRLKLITCDTAIKEEWCVSKTIMLDILFLYILLCVILNICIIIFSTKGQEGFFSMKLLKITKNLRLLFLDGSYLRKTKKMSTEVEISHTGKFEFLLPTYIN